MNPAAEKFRDSTAVAGVGLTIGHFPDKTPLSVAVEAFQLALAFDLLNLMLLGMLYFGQKRRGAVRLAT